jgi:hypothetical protein
MQTQETNVHAFNGIGTTDPSNQAAADLLLRPRGHWDKMTGALRKEKSVLLDDAEFCEDM